MPGIIRLKAAGNFGNDNLSLAEDGSWVERDALLVYVGDFDSADGPVPVSHEMVSRLVHNHNASLAKLSRLVKGNTPLKHCPPVQVDHSTSGWDTVGRVVGDLKEGVYVDEDGRELPAAYGRLRVLGKENVERVVDGRWTHLSVGADFDNGKLVELTITPFPAAPQASMLSKERTDGRKEVFADLPDGKTKICVELDNARGLYHGYCDGKEVAGSPFSVEQTAIQAVQNAAKKKIVRLEGEQMDRERLKKYLTGHKKMTAEEAEKHLSDDTTDLTALSKEAEEHEKKEETERLSRLSAAKTKVTQLASDFRSSVVNAQLGAKKIGIVNKLSRLRAAGKITPAEIKKMDIAKLAGETDAAVSLLMKSYEDREPVIMIGQVGTRKAEDIAKLHKAQSLSRLEQETRANMSMLKGTAKLEDNKKPDAELSADPDADTSLEGECEAIEKLMADGKKEEARARMRRLARLSVLTEETEDAATELSALAEQVNKMQTSFQEVEKLVADLA